MDYIEVEFNLLPLNPYRDILSHALAGMGCEGIMETDVGLKAYWPEDQFNETHLRNIWIGAECSITFTIHNIAQQNWNGQWEQGFQPIRVGEKCAIRATFHEPISKVEHEVIIDPQMSFGTGHHQTTRLMIQLMLDRNFKDTVVADVGCGTGVLAILAEKLGAAVIHANDIDDWAVSNTRQNIALNTCVRITVNKGGFDVLQSRAFTVILANINKNVLKTDLEVYAVSLKRHGTLLLSGFFETDAEELMARASKLGLIFAEKRTEDEWAALRFIKE